MWNPPPPEPDDHNDRDSERERRAKIDERLLRFVFALFAIAIGIAVMWIRGC